MHRRENARAHQEGAEQGQRKREQRKQDGPCTQRAALLRHRLCMDQCHAHKPRHEAGIFHRIPKPPTAPAEFGIRPPATGDDAAGQETPRRIRPWSRPAHPGLFHRTAEQRCDGKRERHRETDIAHVQHGRMEGHARVLQHRIEIRAIGRHRQQAAEWVGRKQNEAEEADRDDAEHRQHARQKHLGQLPAKQRQRHRPHIENQHP